MISKLNPVLGLVLLFLSSISSIVESRCTRGCDLALGSYNVWAEANLSFVAEVLHDSINDILSYNLQVTNQDSILTDTRINIPFSCDCINGDFLGHVFTYSVRPGDTYDSVANLYYANLTTVEWTRRFNSYPPERIPDTDATLNVTVNCSCGDRSVSRKYGLFVTYPLMPGESLESVAAENNLTADLLRRYNPNSNFSAGEGLVFVPGRDKNGKYPPLNASRGFSGGSTAGICVGGLAGLLLLAGCLYFGFYRRRKEDMIALLSKASLDPSRQAARGATFVKAAGSTGQFVAVPPGLTGIMVDKSVEFSYEELAEATDDFSIANKIGQGGFGTVYYAELRGETAAIKKMDMQASREFLAELKVLTNVHHLNLVRLIGYCVERSLFLVYEYIENGNLNQHLRGSGVHPLTWSTRVKIALDSARGLEYIHEHTVPVYIHRDIKSANILIDKNFRAKVADFGLAKLTEVGNSSLQSRLVGTFGYMPPEYAHYGDVSPKVDVYAFGVVLYELISAKDAIVKENEPLAESIGLVALFEETLNQPHSIEDLCKLVDPRLGDDYPLDSVQKMAQLAKACTHEKAQLRPCMRSIVVSLMTLLSSTEDWDASSYENQGFVNLMSGW